MQALWPLNNARAGRPRQAYSARKNPPGWAGGLGDAIRPLKVGREVEPSRWLRRPSRAICQGRDHVSNVAALLLFLAIVVFIVAYLFQPIPVQ
jgi:hypothetical protein